MPRGRAAGSGAPSSAQVIQLAPAAGLTPLQKWLMIGASPLAGCAAASALLFALWAVGWCERAPAPPPGDGDDSDGEAGCPRASHALRGGLPTSDNSIFLQWGTDEWYAAEAAARAQQVEQR